MRNKQEPTQQPKEWEDLEEEFLLKFATFYTPAWGRKYDSDELQYIDVLTANTRLWNANVKDVFQWIRAEIEAAKRELLDSICEENIVLHSGHYPCRCGFGEECDNCKIAIKELRQKHLNE